MNIDYSRFDQIVHAFLTDDKNYEGDPNWDMGEEFQMNILSSLVYTKYGDLLSYLDLKTSWKENTYFDEENNQYDPDPWFALMFADSDGAPFLDKDNNPLFLIKFHFDFERVIKDTEYRNLIAKTVIGPELDEAIEKTCKNYELFYGYIRHRVSQIAAVAVDAKVPKELRNISEDPSDILGANPIEITI